MIRLAAIAALVLVIPAAAKTSTPRHLAQMSRDVVDAVRRDRIEGSDATKVIAALRERVEIDDECAEATRLVIAYHGEEGFIFLVIDEKPCAVVRSPANAIRALLLQVLGQPI
jgi:hypothetical protein